MSNQAQIQEALDAFDSTLSKVEGAVTDARKKRERADLIIEEIGREANEEIQEIRAEAQRRIDEVNAERDTLIESTKKSKRQVRESEKELLKSLIVRPLHLIGRLVRDVIGF